MNNLFNQLGGSLPQNNFSQMLGEFQKFKQSFNGNPREMVMQMLSNGQISQAQLNQVQAMANQLQGILK